MRRFLPLVLPVPRHKPITNIHKEFYLFYLTEQLPGNGAKMLCKISTRLIQLIFNHRPGLVGLELTQNICEGRGVLMVSWKYFNKQNIERSFNMKKPSQTPNNSTIKSIKPGQNIKLNN